MQKKIVQTVTAAPVLLTSWLGLGAAHCTPIARLYMQGFVLSCQENFTFHFLVQKEAFSTSRIPTRCKSSEKGLSSYEWEINH